MCFVQPPNSVHWIPCSWAWPMVKECNTFNLPQTNQHGLHRKLVSQFLMCHDFSIPPALLLSLCVCVCVKCYNTYDTNISRLSLFLAPASLFLLSLSLPTRPLSLPTVIPIWVCFTVDTSISEMSRCSLWLSREVNRYSQNLPCFIERSCETETEKEKGMLAWIQSKENETGRQADRETERQSNREMGNMRCFWCYSGKAIWW